MRKHLQGRIEKGFLGSVLAAARYAEIPQPTLWRILQGGQPTIEARTKTRLRRLLKDLDDQKWESLFFSAEDRAQLVEYEGALEAELGAHTTAYGLASESRPGVALLSQSAEQLLESFRRRAIRQGHHPARVLLATWRIRAPFILGHFGGGLEPTASDLRNRGDDIRIVKLGIRREKTLLRRVPKIFPRLGAKRKSGERGALLPAAPLL
jgi:hypothetical protein